MTKEMHEDVKKWVEALRSGDYKQTRGTLKEKFPDGSYGYCCLGVYREAVMGKGVKPVKRDKEGNIDEGGLTGYDKIRGKLDQSLCSVKEKGTGIYPDLSTGDLIDYNDNDEYTFEQIADEIEKVYQ